MANNINFMTIWIIWLKNGLIKGITKEIKLATISKAKFVAIKIIIDKKGFSESIKKRSSKC